MDSGNIDLLIQNGLVFDGLGSEPMVQDVAIHHGKVVALSPHLQLPPKTNIKEIIDAKGLWVTPGFIDIHTHYDLEVEVSPGLVESLRNGVTTVVMGNCSLSATMGEPQVLADIFQRVETLSPVLIRKWLEKGKARKNAIEYFQGLNELKLGPNVATMLGHSALRAQVMGLERSLTSRANAQELKAMRKIALESLSAGCIGISIDRVPWHMMSGEFKGRTVPSQHAGYAEYEMLAQVCRATGKVFQVNPDPQKPFSVVELLWMSVGVFRKPVRMTMLSALDTSVARQLWRVFPWILFVMNRLLGANLRFQTLTEPFTVFADGPITPVFEEFRAGVMLNDCDSTEERQKLWLTPGFKERFRNDWKRKSKKTFHGDENCMTIVRCPETQANGLTVGEWAKKKNQDPTDALIDLLEKYDTDFRWVATGANDRLAQRLRLMSHPQILPGFTDAGAHMRNLGYYDGGISLLKQAVQTGFMTPARAISRVSGEAAQWFGLKTGTLSVGVSADLLLIDPQGLSQEISPQEEFSDPVLDGAIRMVKRGSEKIILSTMIAGRPVVKNGQVLPGVGTETFGKLLTSDLALIQPERNKERLRNAISKDIVDHSFTDYWDIFVLKHQNPWNVFFHMLGVVEYYGVLVLAAWTQNLKWCLLLPLSQMIGLLGHRLFERSHIDQQDAVFSFRATFALNRMFWRVVTGKYGQDLTHARSELAQFQKNRSTNQQRIS